MEREKLLLMGVSSDTLYVLQYAKKIGVFTIITDNRPVEVSMEKEMADEYWMIDLKDLNALEERCRVEGVKAIYAGNNEFCLDQTRELCYRLGLPFYASEEGWLCARDKKRFKQQCIECGLNVPQEYIVNDSEIVGSNNINYPVVVKPVDSCAQQGFSLCWKEADVMEGINRAKSFSDKGRFLAEAYIKGDELAVHYFLVDGTPILIDVEDILMTSVNGIPKATYVHSRSRFYEEFIEKENEKVKKLFKKLQCRWGNIFLQVIRKNGVYYFLEMGYRIEGVGLWILYKDLYGFSNVELMVDLALGRKITNVVQGMQKVCFSSEKTGGIYLLWARPGKVVQVEGKKELELVPGFKMFWNRFKTGDYIHETGDMYQIAFGFSIIAKNSVEMKEKIDLINRTLHIYDEKKRDMLIYYSEYAETESYRTAIRG